MNALHSDTSALHLALLGTRISVLCRSDECYSGIKEHFHPHCIEDLHRTPDFVIEKMAQFGNLLKIQVTRNLVLALSKERGIARLGDCSPGIESDSLLKRSLSLL